MAFVIEDGTGKPNSNSYASVEEADSYFQDRGIEAWSGTLEQKQTFLIRATDYIDLRFKSILLGQPFVETQALQFPRDIFGGVVPVNLKRAAFEYALRAKSATLLPDPKVDASGRTVRSVFSKTDILEDEVVYEPGNYVSVIKPYPGADMYMTDFIKSRSSTVVLN